MALVYRGLLSKGKKPVNVRTPRTNAGGLFAIGREPVAVSHLAWGAGVCELFHLMAGGLPSHGVHQTAGGLPSDVDSSLHVARVREADS
jgi:hypothetical protein